MGTTCPGALRPESDRARAELEAALDAFEEVASGIAHAIANPAAVVTSNLSELLRYVASYERAIAELTQIAFEAGLAERVHGVLARGELSGARHEAANAAAESLQAMEQLLRVTRDLRSLGRGDRVEPGPGERRRGSGAA